MFFAHDWLKETAWLAGMPTTPPSAASKPNPPDGSAGIRRDATLSWRAGEGALSHEIYFGTVSPGTFQGRMASTTYSPPFMSAETTYYWRVDEVNPMGVTEGEVWTFTTGTSGGTR
ncbi:MAG: hypothetical protein ACYS8Z_05540 [Planctomycetota bacterium]